jgi:ParB family chromosome partitioning protein
VLLSVTDRTQQERLAAQVVRDGLSVRATEQAITSSGTSRRKKVGGKSVRAASDPALAEVAHIIAEHLSTRVEVSEPTRGTRGKLSVEFADAADLERIARTILGA